MRPALLLALLAVALLPVVKAHHSFQAEYEQSKKIAEKLNLVIEGE
jgi:hypothetical protein